MIHVHMDGQDNYPCDTNMDCDMVKLDNDTSNMDIDGDIDGRDNDPQHGW